MENERLFLAIAIPDSLREELADVPRKIKRDLGNAEIPFRFTPPDNLHLTVKFFGSTDKGNEIRALTRKVASEIAPISLEIRGVGAFPNLRAARVIWAGVRKTRELVELKAILEGAYERLGFQREENDFSPHITLARLRNIQSVRRFIEPFQRKEFGEIEVKELALFESVGRVPYPEYKIVERFPFAQSKSIQ